MKLVSIYFDDHSLNLHQLYVNLPKNYMLKMDSLDLLFDM